ncbi:hypothetical protein [Nocardia vaccinii]|uniref:hypothetical protein n=1 Tax=Nocardia vaccinii TaxID=1822 RepID=UPI000829A86A|nr:hypothetical protein [Nocardia vaccinii]
MLTVAARSANAAVLPRIRDSARIIVGVGVVPSGRTHVPPGSPLDPDPIAWMRAPASAGSNPAVRDRNHDGPAPLAEG